MRKLSRCFSVSQNRDVSVSVYLLIPVAALTGALNGHVAGSHCSVRAPGRGSSAPAQIYPGQAARPVPLHQACKGINTTSFSIVGFAFCFFICLFNEGSSQFQRAAQENWSFSPQAPVCHFVYEAAPLILPPKCDADCAASQKAILPSALVESNQGMQQQQIQQPKPCGWEKSAWNSNVVSTGTAMPQKL